MSCSLLAVPNAKSRLLWPIVVNLMGLSGVTVPLLLSVDTTLCVRGGSWPINGIT